MGRRNKQQQKKAASSLEETLVGNTPMTVEQFLGPSKRPARIRSKSPIKRAVDSLASHAKKQKEGEDATTQLPFSQDFLANIAMNPAVLQFLSSVNAAQEADQNKENISPESCEGMKIEEVFEVAEASEKADQVKQPISRRVVNHVQVR